MCIPTRTHLTYNNDKSWFTAKLRQLRQAKEDAYRKRDKVLYKQAKYKLEKVIRVAKRNYSGKLRNKLSSSDSVSAWKGMKDITNYKTPSPGTMENQQLVDNLNEFYCRFEKTPHTRPKHLSTQPLTPSAAPLSPTPALQIREDDVRQVLKKNKRRKAPGPDGVSPACLKTCTDQMAPIFTQIFNRSLELCKVPSCFKHSTIIPIPKRPKITELNDYLATSCGSNVCGHEVIRKTGAGPPEGHPWTLAGSSSVCLPSKQVCGRCSQHVTALCSATSRQTKGLCEDPVCGLQLGL